MASSGKKGKKAKGKTVSLTDFLAKNNANGGPETTTVYSQSCHEEMDGEYKTKVQEFVLPTAPRAAQELCIPEDPPFIAYISNISFNVDCAAVKEFFRNQNVVDVRIPNDYETGKIKGHGYVEFENRESLMGALKMDGNNLKQRSIKIELAKNDGRSTNRWNAGSKDKPVSSRYESINRADDKVSQSWRIGLSTPSRDNGQGQGWNRSTNAQSDCETSEKRNSGYVELRDRDDRRDGNRGYGFGRDDNDRGYGGDRYRRDEGPRDDRGGYDRRDRGNYDRNDRRDNRSRGSPDPPKERPRLQLTKRSERTDTNEEPEGSSKASIFGGAKPVDTAKKEAEIEQKLQESQTRVRTIDLASKRKDEEERRKSSEREQENKKENEDKPKIERASIFGSAKPVDTSAREKEIENKLKQQNVSKASVNINRQREDSNRDDDRDDKREGPSDNKSQSGRSCDDEDDRQTMNDVKKPTSSDIFGSAKPVDTQTREREIEERMKKSQKAGGSSENQNVGRGSDRGYQPPQRRDERDNRNRSNRENDNRAPGGNRRETDRKGNTRDDRHELKRTGNETTNRRDRTPPSIKKIEETKAPTFVCANKFGFLQDDGFESGKGSDSGNDSE